MSDPSLPDLRHLIILVVEDHLDSAEMLKEALSACGATAMIARNATDALTLLRTANVDVLLADIAMPQHDGYWLIEQAHHLGRRPAVVVTLSGHAAPDPALTEKLGISAHLEKPVDPATLCRRIAELTRPA